MSTFEEFNDAVRPRSVGDAIRPRFAGEPIDYLLKRLKRAVNASGALSEGRRHRYALTRSERRRAKAKVAQYKRQREQQS